MWFGASDLLSFIQDKYSPLKHVEVGVNTFTRAMNNVKSFGGPENMRQYEEGNVHGVFYNQRSIKLFDGSTIRFNSYCFGPPAAPLPEEIRPTRIGFCAESMYSLIVKLKIKEAEMNLKCAGTDSVSEFDADHPGNGGEVVHHVSPNRKTPEVDAELERRRAVAQQGLDTLKSQNYFHSKAAWKLFVPKSTVKTSRCQWSS